MNLLKSKNLFLKIFTTFLIFRAWLKLEWSSSRVSNRCSCSKTFVEHFVLKRFVRNSILEHSTLKLFSNLSRSDSSLCYAAFRFFFAYSFLFYSLFSIVVAFFLSFSFIFYDFIRFFVLLSRCILSYSSHSWNYTNFSSIIFARNI